MQYVHVGLFRAEVDHAYVPFFQDAKDVAEHWAPQT